MRAAEEEKSAKTKGGRGAAALLEKKKMGLGLCFFVFFLMLSKLPPLLFELWTSIYR
jgi:hypothetical protein